MTYKTFVVVGMIITLLFSGLAFQKAEESIGRLRHTVTVQVEDRLHSEARTVGARKQDCEGGNNLREGLRTQVEESQRELPLILKLIPQFNSPIILQLNKENVARQLAAYALRDCEAYAHAALLSK